MPRPIAASTDLLSNSPHVESRDATEGALTRAQPLRVTKSAAFVRGLMGIRMNSVTPNRVATGIPVPEHV
ncbi:MULTISPECIES: hypothetical protein [unclassified Microbacterium]|uniref:hypothetical protein n=1 Tax=unclassified Microbacterium TaxID=2609290 RepID=UPI0011BF26D1|nr:MULTISPECIES: hypothetical protein [unclassified Microbacterium]NYF30307.1 hypothetical protein [Microbacterium sp. JAI119]